MRARTDRFVSSDVVPERHPGQRHGRVAGSRTMRTMRASGQAPAMTREAQVAWCLLHPAAPAMARRALRGERLEQRRGRGRRCGKPGAYVGPRETVHGMDRALAQRQAADEAGGALGPVAREWRIRARSLRPRRAQRDRQCVSGPPSNAGCAASIAASSVVPERGPPTTKTGRAVGSVTALTVSGPTASQQRQGHAPREGQPNRNDAASRVADG